MSRTPLAAVVVLALVATLVAAVLILRPSATVTTSGGLAVECAGIGDEAACAAWAEAVLADGPGIHTFDPEDLDGVRLGRSVLGLLGEYVARAKNFLGRFGDQAATSPAPPRDDRLRLVPPGRTHPRPGAVEHEGAPMVASARPGDCCGNGT